MSFEVPSPVRTIRAAVEVHAHAVAACILEHFRDGEVWDFAGPLS